MALTRSGFRRRSTKSSNFFTFSCRRRASISSIRPSAARGRVGVSLARLARLLALLAWPLLKCFIVPYRVLGHLTQICIQSFIIASFIIHAVKPINDQINPKKIKIKPIDDQIDPKIESSSIELENIQTQIESVTVRLLQSMRRRLHDFDEHFEFDECSDVAREILCFKDCKNWMM